VGIAGCAVGASFAVLVAEQMLASGCRLLLSITSAGRIAPKPEQAFFVLIEKALRYHCAPLDHFPNADSKLMMLAAHALVSTELTVLRGAVWTTNAPFRETAEAIAAVRRYENVSAFRSRFCRMPTGLATHKRPRVVRCGRQDSIVLRS
jgi:hypothetical protein